MKTAKFFLSLTLTAVLCLGLASCSGGQTPAGASPAGDSPGTPAPIVSLEQDETPAYLSCRIVDGAEDGNLLLAALDAPLTADHEDMADGRGVYRLFVGDIPVSIDGQTADGSALEDGMPVEVAFSGAILDSFPAQLEGVYSLSAYSLGQPQNPGGTLYDLCGLYLQVLDDLWAVDPGLNSDIAMAGVDLSRAPGGLLESEKSALIWRFGELHGVETVSGTFAELRDQGYFSDSGHSTPAPKEGEEPPAVWYQWEDGCLFTIEANDSHQDEIYSLPALFFNAEKWRSPLGAYFYNDCSCIWPEFGPWTEYTVEAEMIS